MSPPNPQGPEPNPSAVALAPYTLAPDDFVTYGPRDVHGYIQIPPARFSGFAANDWGVEKSDLKLELRLVAHGYHAASIILETEHESQGKVLFGKCPLNIDQVFKTVTPDFC